MSMLHLIRALSFYFEVTVLLSFSSVVLYGLVLGVQKSSIPIRFQDLLKLSKLLIFSSIILPTALLTLPKTSLMQPHAQVFSSGLKKTDITEALISFQETGPVTQNELPASEWTLERKHIFILLGLLIFGGFAQLAVFSKRWIRLNHVLTNSQRIKKIGSVTLLASSEISSPFSCWKLGGNIVVVPTDFLSRRYDFRIALQHELQHHRSGDTRWIFWLELLKSVFYWNPFSRFLISQINLIQEFACDEFLIGHQKTSPQAYGGCLVRTAESAVHSKPILVGTAHMAGNLGGSILKRRIDMLFKTKRQTSKLAVAFIGGIILALMASIAYASQSAVQEKKFTLEEAQVYADKAAKETQIPIDLNDLVLAKLNYFVGTSHGRAWAKNGLARMKIYKKMIDAKTAQIGLPEELIAIPLFESGFQNDAVSPSPYHSKGIWQFIEATGRHYNLTIDDKVDERLDPEKETVAAMRYFSALRDDFHDWRLAIKAYNEGEHQVQKMIDQLGTKDPWVIEHAESKEAYLSGAIAMMIVMKNPELLN